MLTPLVTLAQTQSQLLFGGQQSPTSPPPIQTISPIIIFFIAMVAALVVILTGLLVIGANRRRRQRLAHIKTPVDPRANIDPWAEAGRRLEPEPRENTEPEP